MKKSIKICSFILLTLLYSFSPILSYSETLSDTNLMKKPSNCNVYSSFFKDDMLDINDSYIKNSIIPKHLYVISENGMSNEEKTMISTLQGLVSTKSDDQIYILSSNEPDYQIWLKDLNDSHNVKYTNIQDPWQLLSKFKNYINGYILYSNLKGPSINNACSLASLEDSIVIEESLESKIKSAGVSNLIKDCRDTDKYWAYNNLWNLGLNHSTVIELSPSKYIALRDYSIMSKSLIFYEDDVNDNSLRDTIFKSMDNTSRCLGWGPDEHTNVNIASKFGVDVIASDWSYNLSVLSSYPLATHNQKSNNKIPKEDGVHYITFIMSDGDNQQWFLGSNYSSKSWYGSQSRGNFNLGWSISPSLYYLAPTVFSKYYESASSPKHNDNYVVPPSGNGYMYPSKFPLNKLGTYTKRLNEYMKKVDQKNVLILDDEAFYRKDLWDNYTCHSNINGLFYLNYEKNSTYDGKIIWSNNKPIVSCRDLLWEGLENEEQLINNVNNRINLGYTDIKSADSYTFVYVHVWSKTMDNVQYVVTKLNENSKVRIVTPDTFMKLIQKNITPTI
ncbi:protein phosphatase [Clostridium gasigenes]|uniref:GxGYxYP domain-containing protein n=1 Tax=Clostridium gasigenes TaxID=94869 RepID=UPI001C0E8380|nr:GxGYxYP domain-containing protein [Clostridium gasigenes]MBU3131897.1 protein phosphatase [Clostridium gasigenes]